MTPTGYCLTAFFDVSLSGLLAFPLQMSILLIRYLRTCVGSLYRSCEHLDLFDMKGGEKLPNVSRMGCSSNTAELQQPLQASAAITIMIPSFIGSSNQYYYPCCCPSGAYRIFPLRQCLWFWHGARNIQRRACSETCITRSFRVRSSGTRMAFLCRHGFARKTPWKLLVRSSHQRSAFLGSWSSSMGRWLAIHSGAVIAVEDLPDARPCTSVIFRCSEWRNFSLAWMLGAKSHTRCWYPTPSSMVQPHAWGRARRCP